MHMHMAPTQCSCEGRAARTGPDRPTVPALALTDSAVPRLASSIRTSPCPHYFRLTSAPPSHHAAVKMALTDWTSRSSPTSSSSTASPTLPSSRRQHAAAPKPFATPLPLRPSCTPRRLHPCLPASTPHCLPVPARRLVQVIARAHRMGCDPTNGVVVQTLHLFDEVEG